ncbi:MAG: DNA primase [Clostridia bacterium]|nr:DNA primase [Clostridia bacterium]
MAYYSDELIDEVISQNDIVEVVSEYVTLKKSGRNYTGLCPFHREKTPSFIVSMDKQIFKCFGCSEGGNVISFIMKLEKLDFWESVLFLANRAHVDTSKYEIKTSFSNNKEEVKKDLKEVLYKLNKDAALYYHEALVEKLEEKTNLVKDYIIKRKFDKNVIRKFGVGFGRGTIPLFDYLKNKGYSSEEIFASGIIIEKAGSLKHYDRFDSRLIFPIFDIRDRVIGFGGRVLDNSLPKYVNSPENEIYSKGKNLYALNFAKKENLESIIMVEGYMDALSLHKNNINNVVASLGTALTESQARLLKRFTDKIIIAYDQDSAGQEAILRGLDILTDKSLNVKVLKLDKEDAKDPDEYINKYGVERFQHCVNNSISLVEFKVSKLEKELDLNNIDSKIKFLTQTANILSKIENNIERDIYIDKISEKYKIGRGPILKEIEKRLNKNDSKNEVIDTSLLNKKIHIGSSVRKRQEQYIIALLLSKDLKIQKQIFESISVQEIEDESVKDLYNTIIGISKNFDINKIDILSRLRSEEQIKELTEVMYLDISNVDKVKMLNDILSNKKKEKFRLRRDEIIQRIGQNITKDEEEVLQFELNQIILELSKLK